MNEALSLSRSVHFIVIYVCGSVCSCVCIDINCMLLITQKKEIERENKTVHFLDKNDDLLIRLTFNR